MIAMAELFDLPDNGRRRSQPIGYLRKQEDELHEKMP